MFENVGLVGWKPSLYILIIVTEVEVIISEYLPRREIFIDNHLDFGD